MFWGPQTTWRGSRGSTLSVGPWHGPRRRAAGAAGVLRGPAGAAPGLGALPHLDRRAPRPEAADDRGLREIHVDAVVDHVGGGDEVEVPHGQDGRVVPVGRAD